MPYQWGANDDSKQNFDSKKASLHQYRYLQCMAEKKLTLALNQNHGLSRRIPQTVIITPSHPIFSKLSCCAKCLLHFKTLSLVFFYWKMRKTHFRNNFLLADICKHDVCLNKLNRMIMVKLYVTIDWCCNNRIYIRKKNTFTHTHCVLRVVGHPSSAL